MTTFLFIGCGPSPSKSFLILRRRLCRSEIPQKQKLPFFFCKNITTTINIELNVIMQRQHFLWFYIGHDNAQCQIIIGI